MALIIEEREYEGNVEIYQGGYYLKYGSLRIPIRRYITNPTENRDADGYFSLETTELRAGNRVRIKASYKGDYDLKDCGWNVSEMKDLSVWEAILNKKTGKIEEQKKPERLYPKWDLSSGEHVAIVDDKGHWNKVAWDNINWECPPDLLAPITPRITESLKEDLQEGFKQLKQKKMSDFKVKVVNKEHSKAVQERLFDLGYKWRQGETEPIDIGNGRWINTNDKVLYHSQGNTDNRDEKTLTDLYEMTKIPKHNLQVYKWYHYRDGLFCFQGISQSGLIQAYGLLSNGDWSDTANFGDDFEQWTLASDGTVFARLIQEARKRGFKENCRYEWDGVNGTGYKGEFNNVNDGHGGIGIDIGSGYIFCRGKWATLLGGESFEIEGYELKMGEEGYIDFGCKSFRIKDVRKLEKAVNKISGIDGIVVDDDRHISGTELRDLVEYLDRQDNE